MIDKKKILDLLRENIEDYKSLIKLLELYSTSGNYGTQPPQTNMATNPNTMRTKPTTIQNKQLGARQQPPQEKAENQLAKLDLKKKNLENIQSGGDRALKVSGYQDKQQLQNNINDVDSKLKIEKIKTFNKGQQI